MSETPVLPAYGRGSLSDVLPSLAAGMGVPGYENTLRLPASIRTVVLLVDGLGSDLLATYAGQAPALAGARGEPGSRVLTSGVPSTTATSLTSLGTGLTPGRHGTAGYAFRNPQDGSLLNALIWAPGLDPHTFQPWPTVFERAVAAGVSVSRVLPERFQGSGLTESGLRGGTFVAVPEDGTDARVSAVVDTLADGPALTYCYERRVDHAGHGDGVGSASWLHRLRLCDRFVQRLREELPDDVLLVVTADHGMVNVPAHHRIVVEDEPELARDVDLVAGECRFRQLYTHNAAAVARRWDERLGDRAWVRTREHAVAEGWFGPLDDRVADRFGDVVVAMRSDWAALTTTMPGEFGLVGCHGSLTAAEMLIPLLVMR